MSIVNHNGTQAESPVSLILRVRVPVTFVALVPLSNRDLDSLISKCLAEFSAFDDAREFLGTEHLERLAETAG